MARYRIIGLLPVHRELWPAIASALLTPWPREAVAADLQWWVGQKRPGRRVLAERWGWGEGKARRTIERFVPLKPATCARCGGNGGAWNSPCGPCDGTGSVWVRR